MRKILLLSMVACMFSGLQAQELHKIKLFQPDTMRGEQVMTHLEKPQ